jgi:small nuclear ribonucleoprotein
MKSDRPFDSLISSIDSPVIVKLKDGLVYNGKLASFDIHLNVVLDEANEDGNQLEGKVLIRGDMISTIKNIQ